MRSFKTELYKVSFGQSAYDSLNEVSIEKLNDGSVNDESEWRTYYGFPMLCEYLVELIYGGQMSRAEASKTIAKAMIHLTEEAS
tara:strand:- start:558 stop:809 length:252 start_codon:yes stop_codon:yes gene_type:complete